MAKILVVDDERGVRAAFEDFLSARGHEVTAVARAEDALVHLGRQEWDLVILDIRLPGMSGLDALAQLKRLRPRLPVIVMTGQGTTDTAIEATKRGAFEYQLKPFEPAEMLATIDKALEGARLMKGPLDLGPEAAAESTDAIVGRSSVMQQVYKAIGRVAQTDATVLVRGESGTGKELVARAIYQHSLRSKMPLLVVNCAAIPETLLESELFGYEPGAFTGAVSRRIGKFQQADRGTMFLDEIGDIPLGVQAKILRLLQEMSFERLGSNETVRVDVRVLCATNRDLAKAIADGTFREDLYHRLDVVTIDVPPLRDRRDDIPELVSYFLNRYSRELRIDKPPVAIDAMELLRQYSWPGNVRELEHLIHRVLIFTRGYPIQSSDLPPGLRQVGQASSLSEARTSALAVGDAAGGGGGVAGGAELEWLRLVRAYLDAYRGSRAHEDLLETVEKLLLTEALERCGGNQTHAARLLGVARPTLHAKLQRQGLRESRDE